MRIRANPLLLGSFILGGLALFLIVLLTIGSTTLFQPSGRFLFYLHGSAAGLSEGTGVSLDGVGIGQVEKVNVLYDRSTHKSLVSVLCEINKNLLTDLKGHKIELTDRKVLHSLITEGLRVQIQTSGIVGAKYVEIGFYDPAKYPPESGLPPSQYPVVPSVPSTMSELTGDASQIVANLSHADFQGLVEQAKDVLTATRRQLDTLEKNQLTDHVSSAAESVDTLISSPELQDAIVQVRAAAEHLQELVADLDKQVAPLGNNLNATLRQGQATLTTVDQTAANLANFLSPGNQLGEQTRELLSQLTQTARTIERLAAFLERHPNALVTGRERSPGAP